MNLLRRKAIGEMLPFLGAVALATACATTPKSASDVVPSQGEVEESCPSTRGHEGLLPGVTSAQRSLSYWLERPETKELLDVPLLRAEQREAHNAWVKEQPLGESRMRVDLVHGLNLETELRLVNARFASFKAEFEEGKYFLRDGAPASHLATGRFAPLSALNPEGSLHLANGMVELRCAPFEDSFFSSPSDASFDRNNCSALHPGEPFAVLGEVDGMKLVRSAYAFGFIPSDAPISYALNEDDADRFVNGELALNIGTRLRPRERVVLAEEQWPESGSVKVLRAHESGTEQVEVPVSELLRHDQPLTRRRFLEHLFRTLGEPYAWGDEEGGRDCSRLVMDSLDAFGIRLPRHSSSQSYAGTFYVDVEGWDSVEKSKVLDAANLAGITLLHFPGHIMIYLGKSDEGEPMAFHTFAEYYEPCAPGTNTRDGGEKTLVRAHTTDVTTLRLGEGTDRGSFLERVNRISVIGSAPGPALEAIATLRSASPPAIPEVKCEDSDERALFTGPFHANLAQKTRVVFASEHDPGPAAIAARAPSGRIVSIPSERRAGPPWALVANFQFDEVGTWRVVVGDGPSSYACKDLRVRRTPSTAGMPSEEAWQIRNRWSRRFENLYSVFVHELTRYPLEEGRTWSNLQDLLKVEDKNILYDYLGRSEETKIALEPDCADLPYVLRAYFSWKMGLPYAQRSCNRGRENRPPICGDIQTNVQPVEGSDLVGRFQQFARRNVMSGVHSGNGRTAPQDSNTDLYPVPLTREALRPGIVYADPDGHVLMIAGWVPQPKDGYGVLYAVDAQPDGTIGLRPFWRGTFAFRPETNSVGAGFKAFRPIVRERDGSFRALTNDELVEGSWFYPFSMQMYEADAETFYDTMDGLINPRPIDAWGVQKSRIDSLEASLNARVRAVQLGVDYMRKTNWREVAMPSGYSIFETSGPWEDFATPSRDLRLLAAIDSTLNFGDSLRRNAAHYGIRDEEVEKTRLELLERMNAELASRSFAYERSDGSLWTLSLADVVARKEHLEVAYNLNDCPEYRWGAAPDSDEASTCASRASAAQQARLEEYRPWFANRRRPAR